MIRVVDDHSGVLNRMCVSFRHTASTDIDTLSLHDALPICNAAGRGDRRDGPAGRVSADSASRRAGVHQRRAQVRGSGLGGRQGGPVAMSDTKLEMIVGVFVLIGITALTYLAVKLGKLEVIGGGNQIEIQAEFDSVAGLKTGASVEIAGVPVGHVKRITLNGERALVTFVIKPGVKLYGDSIASVKTRGLIGDKYVSISPGGSQKELTPGSKIRDTESGVDLESLIGEFIHGNVK